MAFHIIRHAFRMIFGNFGQALRVSIGPYLILVVSAVAGVLIIGMPTVNLQGGDLPVTGLSPVFFLALIAFIIFSLFVFGWIAVAWHRFILLEEYTQTLPVMADRPIWSYVGRSVLYGFLIVLLSLPLFFIVGLIAVPLMGSGDGAELGVGVIALSIGVAAILAFVWFRIALALPGIAVGKPITLSQAWAASSGMSGTIFGVAVLLMAINGIAGVFVSQITNFAPIIGFVFELALQWLTLMLGVSILTTLYGHLIEKRPLVD